MNLDKNNTNVEINKLILFLYVKIDDMIKEYESQFGKLDFIKQKGNKRGRKPNLSSSEIVTLAILRYIFRFKEWKHFHAFAITYLKDMFPKIPFYPNFLTQINRAIHYGLFILLIFTKYNQLVSGTLKSVDATPLPVCDNRRISSHRVCNGIAQRGKTSKGWFYGFKLHLVVDEFGNILSFTITPGNIDDRVPLYVLLKKIHGIVLADAGYINHQIMEELFEKGIFLLYSVKGNMKRLMSKEQHKLLKKRQIVEITFGVLKDRYGLETSIPRSFSGHMAHVIYILLAYSIARRERMQLLLDI
jgi:hypothetical protein